MQPMSCIRSSASRRACGWQSTITRKSRRRTPAWRKTMKLITESQYVAYGDDAAIDLFASAMKAKMAECRERGKDGWYDPARCTREQLQNMLLEHIVKGDPVDVGNFAMMLFNRGDRTAPEADNEQG